MLRVRRALLPEELEDALQRLAVPGDAAVRSVVLERYRALSASRRRDADCRLRWLLLRALRDLATPEDVPLLLDATRTFEHMPLPLGEVAHGIRAEGLHRLLEIDSDLARWRAVEMLADGQDNPVSGEPAATALRVLGSAGELALVYAVALDNPYGLPAAAQAEALLWLGELPQPRLRTVVERFIERDDPSLLLAVIDLSVEQSATWLDELLIEALLSTVHIDAFRYAILHAAGRHRRDLVEMIGARLDRGRDRDHVKLAVLEEWRSHQ